MKKSRSMKALAIVFLISGVYDLLEVVQYAFFIATGKMTSDPSVHPFYAIFIALFLFCFAYLQIGAAVNISKYIYTVGVVIVRRVIYAIVLFGFIYGVKDFPRSLLFSGVIDLIWSFLYLSIVLFSTEVSLKDVFIPKKDYNN